MGDTLPMAQARRFTWRAPRRGARTCKRMHGRVGKLQESTCPPISLGVWRFSRIIYDFHLVPFDWDTGKVVPDDGSYEPLRRAVGQTRTFANKMDLAAMMPHSNLASTRYCLASPGQEYLVYQPESGAFTVNLPEATYSYEWFNPATGAAAASGSLKVSGGNQSFTPPFGNDAVLYLKAESTRPAK